ncbi:type IV pilus modification protein PilV [Lysobacter sp. SG-8]|uniref:Type IV pilus modification protein PilV n=2 Tax=Marilutibacter penaei TaxID=2759900 RepID=A0A7W3U333_9GAMM|nr:type IV pilus modification protein PilV [Lysobacter penaei]MBB1088047.1 type IV pilus modification protein PilV [Lysobacter penaei]
METPIPLPRQRRCQAGMSLLEVMIAVLILAIGLLGVAALQATALKNSQGSLARSQAIMESYAILDSIRASIPVAAINDPTAKAAAIALYQMARTCAPPAAGATLPVNDQRRWIQTMQRTLGATSCGTIACNGTVCTVTVEWDESRATGGVQNFSISTVSQL